jgi:hypothetical protein
MTRDEQQDLTKLLQRADRLRKHEETDAVASYDPRRIGEAVSKAVNPAMRDEDSNDAHMLIGGDPNKRICAQPQRG